MRTRKAFLAPLLLAAGLLPVSVAGAAEPEAQPAWDLSATALPSNFTPGSHGTTLAGPVYLVMATNVGAKATTGKISISDTLPVGIGLEEEPPICRRANTEESCSEDCELSGATFTCETELMIPPGASLEMKFALHIEAGSGTALDEATVQGGGAAPATTQVSTPIGSAAEPFGFLAGFRAPRTQADGSAATLAGSHPYQLTADLGFPTEKAGVLGAAGHLRDVRFELPRGETVNPAATPVLCTEAQLTTERGSGSCPAASQVGTVTALTIIAGPALYTSPLYNMQPPPGAAAELGFDAIGSGIFVHISGEVRSETDYGITGITPDTLALVNNPVFGARVQLWGDPSAKAHDVARVGPGKLDDEKTAALTLPGDCSGEPTKTIALADSWEEPSVFASAEYESASLVNAPAPIDGCEELSFEPSISSKPSTNQTDSPTGLSFDLHQEQETQKTGRYTAALKDTTATLPTGLVVNPAAASGQQACSATQIGLITALGNEEAHFSKAPPACPDASKVGTLEARTPLLAEIEDEGGLVKVARNPETGNPIERPVHGSVYLAQPFTNPFSSLLALYIVVEDPQTGTYAKLAGQVQADPSTGQLTTRVTESPELPIEDVVIELFKGPRAALRTPPACGSYSTTALLAPWSGTAPLARSDSFSTTRTPLGGSCPTTPQAAPFNPALTAGTFSIQAGSYAPAVARLSRADGTQELSRFEVTLPPGLTARLAGVPYCTEAEIAQAVSREHTNQGATERADPSCPAASAIGSIDAAAGAGSTPYHTEGHIYLAGPYEGAPLSTVVITPAIAGPFDLGAIVVRAPLFIDPVTSQGRAVSGPLPRILEGIPLDLRSATATIDRSAFTRNPTSCDPLAFAGNATSVFAQSAPLTQRFQVGACRSLPFKPRLSLRLFGPTHRGAHPRLRAVLSAKPGEAGIARTVVALPHSEFLDQGHIRTVCTRVQFAAKACPKGSIYGHATATSPLLDYPLSGPVYLRSSSHQLPDLVVALRGPAYQPIEVDLDGRVDSINGGIRTTFESVPDQPVSKFVLTMQGGKKGLLQNSTDICGGAFRASVLMDGQNGKAQDANPQLRAKCGAGGHKGKKGHGRPQH
jgi:hypothetical protein